MKDRHIVAVHGVGSPEPGSVLAGLMKAVGKPRLVFQRCSRNVNGQAHEGVFAETPTGRIFLWDVNWADIEAAPGKKLLLLGFLLRLLVTMVQVCQFGWSKGTAGAGKPLVAGMFYRWFFLCALIWAIAVPSVDLYVTILNSGWAAAAVVAAIAAGIGYLAYVLWHVDRVAPLAGMIWAAAIAAYGAWSIFDDVPDLPTFVSQIFAFLAPLLILIAGIESFYKGDRGTVFFSRIGMFILSFATISGVGALIWAANLLTAHGLVAAGDASSEDFNAWGAGYLRKTPYNVAHMEYVMAIATGFFFVYLIVGIIVWAKNTYFSSPLGATGPALRDWIKSSLVFLVALFVLVTGALAYDMFLADRTSHATQSAGEDLFEIYLASALRLVPFILTLAIPVGAIVLDVVADILLYIPDKDTSGASTGEKLRTRLRAFLEELQLDPEAALSVVGHSQGSRIAVDVIGEMAPKPLRLATTGSPVSSLYGRFLHRENIPSGKDGVVWRNYYRSTDFIGGAINGESDSWPKNIKLEDDSRLHHINYWVEPDVMLFLLEGT